MLLHRDCCNFLKHSHENCSTEDLSLCFTMADGSMCLLLLHGEQTHVQLITRTAPVDFNADCTAERFAGFQPLNPYNRRTPYFCIMTVNKFNFQAAVRLPVQWHPTDGYIPPRTGFPFPSILSA